MDHSTDIPPGSMPPSMPPTSCDENPDSDSVCRFLKLPAELRVEVYRLILLREKPLCLNKDAPQLDIAILCLNKEIHWEAKHVLYHENVFSLISTEGGERTIEKLRHARPLVREIIVHTQDIHIDHNGFAFITMPLRHFRNLKLFKVGVHSDEDGTPCDITDNSRFPGRRAVRYGTHCLRYLPMGCEVVLEGNWTDNARQMVKNRECVNVETDKWLRQQLTKD